LGLLRQFLKAHLPASARFWQSLNQSALPLALVQQVRKPLNKVPRLASVP
jgi:hypothetical protein